MRHLGLIALPALALPVVILAAEPLRSQGGFISLDFRVLLIAPFLLWWLLYAAVATAWSRGRPPQHYILSAAVAAGLQGGALTALLGAWAVHEALEPGPQPIDAPALVQLVEAVQVSWSAERPGVVTVDTDVFFSLGSIEVEASDQVSNSRGLQGIRNFPGYVEQLRDGDTRTYVVDVHGVVPERGLTQLTLEVTDGQGRDATLIWGSDVSAIHTDGTRVWAPLR